jgi:magnesium-transporting ATPase (P-type)
LGCLGGLIGAIGMAVMEPLSEEAIRSIGLTNDAAIKCGAIAATIAAASLMALSTWESFEGFYSLVSTRRPQFSFYTLFIIIVSLLATLPNAALSIEYLGYDTFFGIFALICNVVGTFSLDYWAIDHLVRELRYGTSKKAIIAKKIIFLRDKLDELQDTSVRFIYNLCNPSI